MFKVNYICSACDKEFDIPSSLNKHINICEKYDDWVKNYKKPIVDTCHDCNKNFINMNEHICLTKK